MIFSSVAKDLRSERTMSRLGEEERVSGDDKVYCNSWSSVREDCWRE